MAMLRIANAEKLTPFAQFTAVGAMCLFGGAYFSSNWKAIAMPLLMLLFSDLVINQVVFHNKYGIMYDSWWKVYGIFALIVMLSKYLLKKISVKNILVGAVSISIAHWLMMDTMVFLGGGTDIRTMLPLSRDWAGYQQCIIQGLPFMKNFLAGTIGYSAIMFGAFELLQVRFPKLAIAE
jgi:hypothetical protein